MRLGVEGVVELERRFEGGGVGLWGPRNEVFTSTKSPCSHTRHAMAFSGDGSKLTARVFRKRTVSSVFWMSGILSFSPALRRCVFTSMNWYLLRGEEGVSWWVGRSSELRGGVDVRDHLLEALHRAVDLCPRGDVVLDFVDEGREGDAARVGGRVFAAGY